MSILILYLLILPAAALSTAGLQRFDGPVADANLKSAGFFILFTFHLYAAGVVLGSLGALALLPVSMLAILCLLLLPRRECKELFKSIAEICRELSLSVTRYPPLAFVVLLFVVLQVGAPMNDIDSLIYHLPSIRNIVETASTWSLDPALLFNPNEATAYYPRGTETVYALFYLFPIPTVSIAIFKTLLFTSFYFLVKSASRSRLIAASSLALLLSTQVVWHDLGSLKNDLPLALAIAYSTYVLVMRRAGGTPFLSLTAALALAVAMKANAVLYAAPLGLLWLVRERRHLRRLTLCAAAVAIFGGFFYFVNIVKLGSPVYPYELSILNVDIFQGEPNTFGQTTILANLDSRLPLFFARGLIRQVGPLGSAALALAVLLALGHAISALIRGHRFVFRKQELLFLLLYIAAYTITPFSDRNSDEPHNQLVSGHTIRMLLPFLLFFLLTASRAVAICLRKSSLWARILVPATGIIIVTNIFWYDVLALVVKPGNAFASVAPIAGTFSNLTLGIVLAAATAFLALLALLRKAVFVPILLVASALLVSFRYPSSLSYTLRFKQIGITTAAFDALQSKELHDAKVAVVSQSHSSYFVGSMNDILMKHSRQIRYVTDMERLDEFDLIVVCAVDEALDLSYSLGRSFGAKLSPLEPHQIPEHSSLLYEDDIYVIYAKSAPANEYAAKDRQLPELASEPTSSQ